MEHDHIKISLTDNNLLFTVNALFCQVISIKQPGLVKKFGLRRVDIFCRMICDSSTTKPYDRTCRRIDWKGNTFNQSGIVLPSLSLSDDPCFGSLWFRQHSSVQKLHHLHTGRHIADPELFYG